MKPMTKTKFGGVWMVLAFAGCNGGGQTISETDASTGSTTEAVSSSSSSDSTGAEPTTTVTTVEGTSGVGPGSTASTDASDTGSTSTSTTTSDDTTEQACPIGEAGCACGDEECVEGLVCADGVCVALGPLLPRAPSPEEFMWQTVQTEFIDDNAVQCTGKVVVAMGDQAVCYLDSDGELKCAGRVFKSAWGPTFTGIGVMDVEQVLLGPTFNNADGNGMCVLAAGQVQCMGRNNNGGLYGTGDKSDVPVLTAWGEVQDITRIATGTFDQICAIDIVGDVYCAGFDYGLMPTLVANGAARLWVDTFGELRTDDPPVWRASAGRSSCQVRAEGLACDEIHGPAGQVVDGGAVDLIQDAQSCWLDDAGKVQCQSGNTVIARFEAMPVLALASNLYTDSMCVVYQDASLACVGSNTAGKLGTGDLDPLVDEQVVRPAGSVHIDCK